MKIDVTREDIRCGIPQSAWRCPLARAIKRAGKMRDGDVLIDPENARFCVAKCVYKDVKLPSEACLFVFAFDNGDPVEPFTFDLEYPCELT